LLAVIVAAFVLLVGASGVLGLLLLLVELAALVALFFVTRSQSVDPHSRLMLVGVLAQMMSVILTVLGVIGFVIAGSYGVGSALLFSLVWIAPPATSGVLLLLAGFGLTNRRPWSWWLAIVAGLVAIGGFLSNIVIFDTSPVGLIGFGGRNAAGIDLVILLLLGAMSACLLNLRGEFRATKNLGVRPLSHAVAITVPAAAAVFMADVALAFAILSFYVGYVRGFDPDGAKIFLGGFLYLFLAVGIGASGLGISLGRQSGWGLGLIVSIAALVLGVYRLSEGPTLGLAQSYGGWPTAGVWLTTILGAVLLGCLILTSRFLRGSGHAKEGPPEGPFSI